MSGKRTYSTSNADSSTAYEPSETDSLLSQERRRSPGLMIMIACFVVAFLVVPFMGFNLIMHFINCPIYPSTMNSIRKSWEIEAADHQLLLREWTFEEEEHTLLTETWKRQAQQHEKDVERRKRDEEQRQEKIRKEWDHEVEEHDRLLKDRRKREEEERQKLNMFWGHVEAHQCTTYGTKEYTALLMNLPATWEHRVEACKVTPLEVHGISYLPKSCEDKGPGVVTGRWEINHNEPDCASYWRSYQDKGCTSKKSGKRRIEHYLENLPHGGDWREFCATTPVSFHDMHFVGAQECFQQHLGTYGNWEIDDNSC